MRGLNLNGLRWQKNFQEGRIREVGLDVFFHITKDAGNLYRIDRNTAVAILVGNTGITGTSGFSGLAYGPDTVEMMGIATATQQRNPAVATTISSDGELIPAGSISASWQVESVFLQAGAEANLTIPTSLPVDQRGRITRGIEQPEPGIQQDFPSADSTVVASIGFVDSTQIGYFWSVARGDSVQETFVTTTPTITGAVFDFVVPYNSLSSGAFVDWNVRINGTLIGSFRVNSGQTGPLNLAFTFAAITGPNYTVRFEVTNEVPSGSGSITLGYAGIHAGTVQLQSASGAACYDVYFGTNAGALSLIASNITETTCDPGLLAFDTTYYWQVVASNAVGCSTGLVWSFTTASDVIEFASAAYAVNEDGGSATITVVRANGSLDGVTVEYATSDGTATAGADYVMTTGTLTFAAGQLTNSFVMPILNDGVAEPDETVNLVLSNPSSGAILGSRRAAVLTIVNDDIPPEEEFRILSLLASGSQVVDHDALTGDDRGGIAISHSHVFYSGDNSTARFLLGDLSGGAALGSVFDALVSDLRSGEVYSLANGLTPLTSAGGTVTTLVKHDPATGVLTTNTIALSAPISLPANGGNVGIFAGYGRILVHTGSRVFAILLPTGIVQDLGAMSSPSHMYTENWAYWGVAEYHGGTNYLAYVQNSTTIVRTAVPAGTTTTLATFANLSDMACFTVSVPLNRWYFHHEGSSQFGGTWETIGYADATFFVGPIDDLNVAPDDGLLASGYEGGPFNPPDKVYTLTNTGQSNLTWEATWTQSWVTVSPPGGTLAAGLSTNVTVAINAGANALSPDVYGDTAVFSNALSGYTQTRSVGLTVLAIPGEIEVLDSIPPNNDTNMPFGQVIIGLSRTEQITISNTDALHDLMISDISFGRYEEDFNDGLAQDWAEISDEQWEVVAGEYRAQTATSFIRMQSTYSGERWADCTAQVVMRRTGDLSSVSRLLIRASEDFNGILNQGNAYAVGISGNGSYYVGKFVSGVFTFIQDWTSTPYLNVGEADNTVRVAIVGSTIRVDFNGQMVWSGTDTSISASGRIGFLPYSGTLTTHYFDDVLAGDPSTFVGQVSAEQAWYNAHPYEGGSPEAAPKGWQPPAFTGVSDGNVHGSGVLASVSCGPFTLTNLPAFPCSLPAGSNLTFDVIYAPQTLGSNTAAVVIESNDADEPRVEVALSGEGIADYLTVTPATGFNPSGHPGGPFSPSNAMYQVGNIGPVPVQWIASHTQTWLQVEPPGGTMATGATVNVTVSLTSTANSLPEGVHTDTVVFADLTTTISQSRQVTLTVFTSPEIWVSSASFDVTNALNGTTCRTLTIGNNGDADLHFTIRSRQTGYTPLEGPPDVAENRIEDNVMVLEYAFDKPVVEKRGEYDYVSIEGLRQYLRTGAPIVPVRPATVLVPYGKKVVSVRVTPLEQTKLEGAYRLPPAQPPFPLSRPEAARVVPPDPAIYQKVAPWPDKSHEQLDVQSKRGYQLLTLSLLPLQYTPPTGQIEYAERLRVEITLADAGAPGALRVWNQAEQSLARRADNPQTLATYPENDQPVRPLTGPSTLPAGGPYDYVIITTPELAGAPGPWNLQALRDARIAQGMTATIVSTDWIYANYSGTRPDGGTDNQTRIRNFLMDAYQTWGTRYALLAGTATLIPARLFWVDSYAGEIDQMPVDMYYGCVEPATCTFDGDADGLYGEPTDGVGGGDVDLEAEIYVGRAAVEDATELSNFVRKALSYDQSTSEYLPRVTMLGEYLGFGGVSDYATGMMEQIRLGGTYDGYFTYGFENHPQSDFYQFNTSTNLYDAPGYSWLKTDLIALMNRGTHVFNHLGHANQTYVMKMYNSDLASVTNSDYFFVYSQGCMPGWFDAPNCFAEEITAMGHGAFAVVMNARYGWGSGNSTDGPSQRFGRQYWDAVLGEDILELGRANQDSKEDNLWDINGSCIRWCYYELNLFGDPAQQFRFVESAEWIDVDPAAGTVPPGASTNVEVCLDATGLDAGVYGGDLIVVSDDVDTPSTNVPCTMTVLPDDLRIEPRTAFESGGPQGGPFVPASMIYTLTNAGTASLDWTLSHAEAWLDVSAAGSTLAAGGATGVTVAVNAEANGLPGGTYTNTLVFSNLVSGAVHSRGVSLRVIPPRPDYFTELFQAADNDLDYRMLTFVPDGSLSYYTAYGETIAAFPTDPSGGTVLSLGDDDYEMIALSSGVHVYLYGVAYDRLYVGSNGYITFGAGDTTLSESLATHFNLPRVSGLFDDLYPSSNVSWKQLADRVAITFNNVRQYGSSDANSFQFEMFFDGTIRIAYLNVDMTDGLAGLSRGTGVPGDFVESDLTSYGPPPPPATLRIEPSEGLVSWGYEGGPFTPSNLVYTVSNVGTVGLSWAASSTQGWVTVDPSEGNLAPGGSPNGVTVLINTNAQSLSNGVYTATVIFSNLISRTTQTRAVQLTVAEPPQPPPAPCCPIPTNNATGVPVPTLLSWNNVQAIRHAAPPSIPANGSGSAKREDEIQTASAGAREAVGSGDSQPRISGASTLVIETGAAISNSVLAVLDNLGHPYDFVHTDVLSSLDLSGYNTVILGMDGGLVNYASMAHLANAINAGGKLIVLGGSSYQPFVSGLNDFFIRVNTNSYMWSTVSGSPDISVTDPSHPLATGLPLAYNFVNSSATYYMARVTDGSAAMVALNGDGYACLSTKPVGTGTVILFINSVYQNYWSNLGDSNVLRTVIANALQFGTSAATYDVYFGTNTAAMTLIASNLTQTTCDPGLLGFDTTYYWQVIASNPAGTTPGPVWSFTTELCPSSSAI